MAKSIEKQVRDLIGDDKTGIAKEELLEESMVLKRYIEDGITDYYRSYSPIEYVRTGQLGNSVEDPLFSPGKKFNEAIIAFNQNAYHPSLFSSRMSHVPGLINYGWQWSGPLGTEEKGIHRFTYFEGYPFIETAIAKYFATRGHNGVVIEVHRPDGQTEEFK